MKWEQFAFPAMILAAVLAIWYYLRGGSQPAAPAGIPAPVNVGETPLVIQLPQVQTPGNSPALAPPRWNPPATLEAPVLYTGLRYPSLFGAQAAAAPAAAGGSTAGAGGGCGCGC